MIRTNSGRFYLGIGFSRRSNTVSQLEVWEKLESLYGDDEPLEEEMEEPRCRFLQ